MPLIIKGSEIFRDRQTAALLILRELELPELMTYTEKEYIELSVVLGNSTK
ncbi:MAG: hypothetical protein WBA93_17870 [Microcoleaceae cyanobacterium]